MFLQYARLVTVMCGPVSLILNPIFYVNKICESMDCLYEGFSRPASETSFCNAHHVRFWNEYGTAREGMLAFMV